MAVHLHTTTDPGSLLLVLTVAAATVGAALLLGLAFAAFVRRRSRPYLLLLAALVALFGRSLVAGISVFGMVSPSLHHLLEHGFDVLLVALVVAAVYYAREVSPEVTTE
jgi:hypothetical protein